MKQFILLVAMIVILQTAMVWGFECGPIANCWDGAYNICCTNNVG